MSGIKMKNCKATNTVSVDRAALITLLNKVDDMRCWLYGFQAGGGDYRYDLDRLERLVGDIKEQVYHGEVEQHL